MLLCCLFLLSFSEVVSSLSTRSLNFPAFCGCESILGRESTDVICCVHLLSPPFMLHSFPFTLLSCPVMFHRYVSKIQVFEMICSNHLKSVRCVSAQTLTFFSYVLSFVLSSSYRFGGLWRLPSSGFMNMYMYKLVIVLIYSSRFLGRQRIGSVKVQAKQKCNGQGHYTILCGFSM